MKTLLLIAFLLSFSVIKSELSLHFASGTEGNEAFSAPLTADEDYSTDVTPYAVNETSL
jgi:hypothetical protein